MISFVSNLLHAVRLEIVLVGCKVRNLLRFEIVDV